MLEEEIASDSSQVLSSLCYSPTYVPSSQAHPNTLGINISPPNILLAVSSSETPLKN